MANHCHRQTDLPTELGRQFRHAQLMVGGNIPQDTLERADLDWAVVGNDLVVFAPNCVVIRR